MKAKNNLELFKNEIMYEFKHHPEKNLWDIMSDIYRRETDVKICLYDEMFDWFSDVPRETLELGEFEFNFINQYFDVMMNNSFMDVNKPLEYYCGLEALLHLKIIPSKYSSMNFNKFIKIIRLKKENKK